MTEEPSDFAGLLRRLRVMAGLTQEELAEGARLGVNTVGDLERGRHPTCHRETAQRLAGALGLTDPVRIVVHRGGPRPRCRRRQCCRANTARRCPGRRPRLADGEPGVFPALQVRYSLLPDAAAFTGRDEELGTDHGRGDQRRRGWRRGGDPRDRRDAGSREDRAGGPRRSSAEGPVPRPAAVHRPARAHSRARIRCP